MPTTTDIDQITNRRSWLPNDRQKLRVEKSFPAGETWRREMMKATPASVINPPGDLLLTFFTRQTDSLRTDHPILI